jgi:hypothetical protein
MRQLPLTVPHLTHFNHHPIRPDGNCGVTVCQLLLKWNSIDKPCTIALTMNDGGEISQPYLSPAALTLARQAVTDKVGMDFPLLSDWAHRLSSPGTFVDDTWLSHFAIQNRIILVLLCSETPSATVAQPFRILPGASEMRSELQSYQWPIR